MNPKYITVHCSASRLSAKANVESIRREHKAKGWSDIGYHYVIDRDGSINTGRPLYRNGAHVQGHNTDNIGICLIGGVTEALKPVNNYTDEQWGSLRYLLTDLISKYGIPLESIKGHRDWFPDLNGDGVIDKRDWLKDCPCFNVSDKLTEWGM